MIQLQTTEVAGHVVRVVASERSDGDMNPRRVPPDVLEARQRRLTGSTWSMLEQVHGTLVVTEYEDDSERPVGDVAVSSPGGHPVAVWTADCAPLALVGSDATVVVVHAGWKGIAAGVIQAGAEELRSRSVGVVSATLGPVIHPCCYEFDPCDIATVETAIGARPSSLLAHTSTGRPALDVPTAVATVLGSRGIALDVVGPCTGCDERWFSHRRRGESGRHAVVAWSEPM